MNYAMKIFMTESVFNQMVVNITVNTKNKAIVNGN